MKLSFVGCTLALTLCGVVAPAAQRDEKPVPKDSARVTLTGCLKGRAFRAVESREPETGAPNVAGRTYRLVGPKLVMEDVKKYNGRLVEVTGIVKRADLAPVPEGFRVGGGRVTVGQADPMRDVSRSSGVSVPVMDTEGVRYLSDTCPAT